MDWKGKYTVWMRCDRCTRAFSKVDLLINHKNEAHPEILEALLQQHKIRGRKRKKEVKFELGRSAKEQLTDEPILFKKRSSIKSEKKNQGETPGPKKKVGRPRGVNNIKIIELEAPFEVSSKEGAAGDKQPQLPPEEFVLPCAEESPIQELPQNVPDVDPPVSSSQAKSNEEEKKKTNAYDLLFLHSVKMKKPNSMPMSSPKIKAIKATPRGTGGVKEKLQPSVSEEKYPCPQCSRNLHSAETLKLHLKLHEVIYINSKSSQGEPMRIPCGLCGRMMTGPPYKCVDCPNSRMVFDFPKIMVKDEPKDDTSVKEYELEEMVVCPSVPGETLDLCEDVEVIRSSPSIDDSLNPITENLPLSNDASDIPDK